LKRMIGRSETRMLRNENYTMELTSRVVLITV
jgi:hypothetical protein